jgi:hypothetical protein
MVIEDDIINFIKNNDEFNKETKNKVKEGMIEDNLGSVMLKDKFN